MMCVCVLSVCVVAAAKSPKDNINKPEEERAEAIKVPLLLPPLLLLAAAVCAAASKGVDDMPQRGH